ncbi:putative secreted protein [Streptomyces hygroscopicus subsp. jinggangensis 5008]|nr:putative secreted protein [Streptomyces hygroscopicus subsp. jinggangensis 5008]AGF60867.1 putative secreted protein [Streptomyces hygroscopicus subsp. jinggangensis TL01]
MRLARTTVAAAAVFAAFLASTTAHAAPAAAAPLNTVTLPVQDALAQLPVRSEDRTGYERTKFEHWVDADKGGCNTCAEVLEAEAVVAPEQGASCRCQYVTGWVATKMRWAPSVDTHEQAAITEVLGHCPNVTVTITPAR